MITSCGTIKVTSYGSKITLPDGTVVPGAPKGDAEQSRIAAELGYGTDVLAMVRDHDPLHVLLCAWLKLPVSYSMHVAAGLPTDEVLADLEECAVMAVQKFMRAAGQNVAGLIAQGTVDANSSAACR